MKRLFAFTHFRQLSHDAQHLSIATIIYNSLVPIMGIFINAFIWAQFHDIKIVSLYNVSGFFGLPIGFYISGWLLKKIPPIRLFFCGTFLQSLTITTLIIFHSYLTSTILLIFGCMYGLSTGLYFSNRHMLSIRATKGNNRIYFNSIDATSATVANMIVPVIIGYFIVYGAKTQMYTSTQAYYYIAGLLILGTLLVGLSVRNVSIELPKITKMMLHKTTKRWVKIRSIAFICGLFFGVMNFLPTLLILSFIGKEDTLGTVQSAAAVITVIVLLIIGKKTKPHQKAKVLAASIILSFIGTFVFSIFYSTLGVLFLVFSQTISQPLLVIAIGAFSYDVIEKESDRQFSYVLDNEIFSNLGRVMGIIVLLVSFQYMPREISLKIVPLFFALTQTLLFFFMKSIEKKERQEQPEQQLATMYNLTKG